MRLNWFSPLPPAKSGIADYTKQLLPDLTAAAEIILWTDQEYWDPALEVYAEVHTYRLQEMPWAEVNRATMSIFHIGNNHRFHGPIWQVSQRHAGLIVLHDVALQQLFAGLFREQWHDRIGYLELMGRFYGATGRRDGEDFWAGRLTIEYMAEQYRLTPHAMDSALGVLVHSQRSFEELGHDSSCPLRYAPLPYPIAPSGSNQVGGKGTPSAGGPPYHLIIFGHISENRRLTSVFQALATFSERERFRLHVYGELWDHQRLGREVEELGLQGVVTLHGFVPYADLEAALASAHLAINLRFPTMGEASVSQLQIWDHALPSLVTKVGWYASLPAGMVAFVRPEHEIMDIQAHLRAFLSEPRRYAKMGEDGRRYVQTHHTPGAYVQAIIDAVRDAEAFRPSAIAHTIARRVSLEMRQWTDLPARDVASYLGRQVGGFRHDQADGRTSLEGLNYRHLEALKGLREKLSDQVQEMQRQLSRGLQAIQRAAWEECYPSAYVQAVKGYTHSTDPSLAVSNMRTPVSDVMPEANGMPPACHPASPGTTGSKEPAMVVSQSRVSSPAAAEFTGRKSYTREDALRYPLSLEAHDTGFRYLFNFMVVAKSLGLRPGDEVLDFGAGSCYVSELLNRLGYLTVAFDIDQEVLAIGRERLTLDPRCHRERARFVTGDGMCLPFKDASIDGIICMNALHHMPDYRATLAEMCRVLKAGGRAVFSEPGDEHSRSPESIMAVEQFGAVEKDIVLPEIYQLAKEVGFARMILKPYVLPDLVELDYEEFDPFRKGQKVSGAFLSCGEIADFVRGQPLFCLEKSGTRALTSASAPAATLRAKIVVKECPSRIREGRTMTIVALCENVGGSLWLSTQTAFGGYVTFGVKFLTPDGRVLEESRGRQRLSHDVAPGNFVEVVTEVSLDGFKPGRYRVLFDMVNELVCWFQSVGSEVVERWIEIV
jgi:ubiquinone/menaquinone biosynthesis C-methylase UbiE/glycosyltransferase involved in cell wall biosynthesis